MFDAKLNLDLRRSGCLGYFERFRGHRTPGSVLDRKLNSDAARLAEIIRNPAQELHACRGCVDEERACVQARTAEVQQVHMHRPRDDQRHVSINAAKNKKIAGQRNDILGRRAGLRPAIVGLDHQDIVAGSLDER